MDGSVVWGLNPFMDICPRCSLYKQLVLGLKVTPPVCIDCAIDKTWINPQDNWGEEGVILCQGNAFNGEIGHARVLVWHPKYSVIEQTGGDRELIIVYWTGEKYRLPRGNGQALHTQMARNTMPSVITQKEVNIMTCTVMEQKNSTQMEIERSSTSKDTLGALFQVELSKLKEEETQANKSLAYKTSMTYRQEIASPLLRQLLIDSQDFPAVATPKREKVIIDRAYNVAIKEKQNHKNVEDPSIQKVGNFYSNSDLPCPTSVLKLATTEKAKPSKKFINGTSTTTKHSELDAEKPIKLDETDKLASVNMFSVKLPEFDTFKDFQDAIKTIMFPNKDSASKSEARMNRGRTVGKMEKDGGLFVIKHRPKISCNHEFAFQDKTRTELVPKETIVETAVAVDPENHSQIKAEMMQKVKEEHLTKHDTSNQTSNPSERCMGDNYRTKISKEIPAKVKINKPRIQKAVSKQLTKILKKQKMRIERDACDPTLDGKESVKKNFPNTSGAMLLVKGIEDIGMTSTQGIQSNSKDCRLGPEPKVKLFDVARLKEDVYRQEDNFRLAFKIQKTSKPNQNKPKIQNAEVVNGSSNDIGKTCKVGVQSGLVLRNGRTLRNQLQTEQNSKDAKVPSRQGPGEKCKSPNQEIHHQIVARKPVIQNQEHAKINCMKHGKPLAIPQAPLTKSVAVDLPKRNEEKPQKEDLRQTVVIAKDISTQTEGRVYNRNSEESKDVIEKSKTQNTMLLSEIPHTAKILGKIPFKRAESTKSLPGELIDFAKSQNAEKRQQEILDTTYNTMVSEVEISIQDKAGMLKIQNNESTVGKGIGKTQNAMLLSEMPQDPRISGKLYKQAKSTNASHIAMANYADKSIKEQRMMIDKQEIAHNEGLVFSYGQKEKLQGIGETSTISRQEGPTVMKAKQPTIENSSKKILDLAAYKELHMKDPRIRAKTLKGYQNINEMTCMKSPLDKMPNLATKEQIEEGEIYELVQHVSFDIQIHVFGKDSQRINPNMRDVNICHWSQLWFETKPRKVDCQSRDVVRAEQWQRITSILAGCANPNLIFKSWGSHVGKDMMSKSVHVVSFMLRNKTLAISVYAHALGLWAYVKEPNVSGKYYRKKYFIANVKHEMTDDFKIGLQDDGCERKGVKRSWKDVQPKSVEVGQAPYKKVCERRQMYYEQKSIVFRRERHSSQNVRPVEVNPSCSYRKSYDSHW